MNSNNALQKLLESTNLLESLDVEAVKKLLSIVKTDYSPRIEKVINDYDLNRNIKFNIFETISDLYKREKFHSDILYTILDFNTPEIGFIHHTEILKEFIKMIDPESDFIIDDTVEITKEKYNIVCDGKENKEGYIDLLISNGHNQAIIIENKIKDASDQPNQLVRYMSFVNEQLFTNKDPVKMIVVYLTLIPGKLPDFDNYSDYFSEYIEMIKDAKNGKDGKILKYRSAVDNDSNKGSLVKFLQKCQKLFTENNNESVLKKVYLDQYKVLLKHLGGKAAMLEYQKDLLKNIYSSEENYKAASDLWTVFSDEKIVMQYFNDCLKSIVEPLGFSFEDNYLYKFWDKNHTDYLFVYGPRKFQFGFGTSKTINKTKQNEYQKILEKTFNTKIEEANESWVYLNIEPLAGKKSLEDFLKYCTSFIPQIKKQFQKV